MTIWSDYADELLQTKDAEAVLQKILARNQSSLTTYSYIHRIRKEILLKDPNICFEHDATVKEKIENCIKDGDYTPEQVVEIKKQLDKYLAYTVPQKMAANRKRFPLFSQLKDLNKELYSVPLLPDWFFKFYVPKDVRFKRKAIVRKNEYENARAIPNFAGNRRGIEDPISEMQKILERAHLEPLQSLIMAIVFTTGRRPVEVIKTGVFKEVPFSIDNPAVDRTYEILFSGKVKTTFQHSTEYIIKSLVPCNYVLRGVEILRQRIPDPSSITNDRINSIYSKTGKVKEYFGHGWTYMKLRGAYALLTKKMFQRESSSMSILAWTQKQLCHHNGLSAPNYMNINIDKIPVVDVDELNDKLDKEAMEIIKDVVENYSETDCNPNDIEF
jgi:hypothetical protein